MEDNDKIIIEVEEDELEREELAKKKTRRVLAFALGKENYCIDIGEAKEVARPSEITRVPNTPVFVKGIMNLRGDIIAMIDIRYFFGLNEAEKSKDQRVIVTDVPGSLVGIIADKVEGTIDVEEDKIEPPLATLSPKIAAYTKGQVEIDKEIFILLDLKAVFRCDEIENLKEKKNE